MAHKTLVDSTEYEVTGGLTLVEGTSYSIKNGKVLVDGTEYDISFLLPPNVLDLWNGTGSYNSINCITYANGYWVVGGQYADNNYSYARIAYATSLDGTWTTKDLWGGGSKYDNIYCITYANGYWVVGGQYRSGNYLYAYIAYATNPDETWKTKIVWHCGDIDNLGITCITYADGYWVVGGDYYNASNYYARIAYATSPDGTWTTNDLWSGSGEHNHVNCITYANGYWVVGGQYRLGTSGGSGSYYARIAYTTSLDGTWTTKDAWYTTTYYYSSIYSIAYANGYWVVGGQSQANNYTYARIAYTTSLDGTWTTKDVWSSLGGSSLTAGVKINGITYVNGYWVVGGQHYTNADNGIARIAYATSLDGTWTTKDLWTGGTTSAGLDRNSHFFTYVNGYLVFGGQYYDGSTYYGRIAYAGNLTELGQTS